jgi:DNA-binding IclR family transcriptional regulator
MPARRLAPTEPAAIHAARRPPRARRPGGASPNRSLERGVEVLRAFRAGASVLGNGELAERTGLSRSTVSRLAQTLERAGLLEHDRAARAYRLAPPVLGLALAMRSGSTVLGVALPLMRSVAERAKVNVGIAVADRDEMLYLDSVRVRRRAALRNVVAGQRVPIELTSLGRAWLAAAPEAERDAVLARIAARRGSGWAPLRRAIEEARRDVRRRGWCVAAWQPEVVAVAAPLVLPDRPLHVVNVSVSTAESPTRVAATLGPMAVTLVERIATALAAAE